MPRLLLATRNPGKQRELRALLAESGWEIVTPEQIGVTWSAEETGRTYAENAAIKALAAARATGLWALADDSGLEVDALDRAPGLYSARFGPPRPEGQPLTDADRRRYLLQRLAEHPRPWTARFRSVVAVAAPEGLRWMADGLCEGEIIPEERGENGFGYDPIFYLPELGRTMAELDLETKNRWSHRGQAVARLLPALRAAAP
ncbi:MAG: RdgB/HAM1 family non-canonical purine NTP pyrophosphatase [Chloroflexi bacterium]|nr:RdgB/HAM1 family non-canonical purine NTP pyrophosphatase [Chloroflexota bacterium]